jgi:hypothetical protein
MSKLEGTMILKRKMIGGPSLSFVFFNKKIYKFNII